MTEKKILKRSVKAVWEEVKTLRADRAKLYGPNDIAASADQLVGLAEALRDLAKKLSALNAMPPDAIADADGKPKRKRRKKGESET